MTYAEFISPEGATELGFLRTATKPLPARGVAPIKLLARVPSEECGCPEELWRIDGLLALMHFESDGSSEVFLYAGDWEAERSFESADLNDLRGVMLEFG